MKVNPVLQLCLALALVTSPAMAQESFFEFASFEEGLEVAKEQDKLVLVYFFDEEDSSADAYNHIWRDPLVTRFVDKLAVSVVISSASEAGEAFAYRNTRRKRKISPREPGIYFFSERGRTLGVLRGALDGQEGIGQMMLMLGAVDYARHENRNDEGRRRFMRHW